MVQAYEALQDLHGFQTDIVASRHELYFAVQGSRTDLDISDAEIHHFITAYVQKFSSVRTLEMQANFRTFCSCLNVTNKNKKCSCTQPTKDSGKHKIVAIQKLDLSFLALLSFCTRTTILWFPEGRRRAQGF
jgi:hypothetical protein